MSKIEITSSNIDKFVKRFHKVSDAKNNGKKLSDSQEVFAQSLGCSNYNELKTALEKEIKPDAIKTITSNQNELYKGIDIENAENLLLPEFIITLRSILKTKTDQMNRAELFYNQLLTLIHHPKSKISSCLFEKDGFNYSFTFKSCYDDVFVYTFGAAPSNEKNTIHNLPKWNGFSPLDCELLKTAFSDNDLVTNIHLTNRFEAIDFANDLYNYLKKLRGDKKIYAFKFNKDDSVNNDTIVFNDSVYQQHSRAINSQTYKKFVSNTKTSSCNKYLIFNDYTMFSNIADEDHRGPVELIFFNNVDNRKDIIMNISDVRF